MIEIKKLNKQFGKLHVLQNINLAMPTGNCYALIGPNGCGKTTLIKSLLGVVIPDSGEIYFNAKPILKTVEYKKNIGFMPQIGRYPDNLSIGQVIHMIQELRNHNQPDLDLYLAYKLNQIQDKKMRTLSGGTRQKVSATLAFMFNPNALILDEPTAGLDPIAAEILKDKIQHELKNGKLIMVTSHLLNELDEIANRVIFMQEGKIKFNHDVDTLKQNTNQTTLAKAVTSILKGGANG